MPDEILERGPTGIPARTRGGNDSRVRSAAPPSSRLHVARFERIRCVRSRPSSCGGFAVGRAATRLRLLLEDTMRHKLTTLALFLLAYGLAIWGVLAP